MGKLSGISPFRWRFALSLFVLSFLLWFLYTTLGGPSPSLRVSLKQLGLDKQSSWSPPKDWDSIKPVYNGFSRLKGYDPSADGLGASPSDTVKKQRYDPYSSYTQDSEDGAAPVPCKGPRGVVLSESEDDAIFAYPTSPSSFPEALLGSNRGIGLDQDVCFDRTGRFAAYGMQSPMVRGLSQVDWNQVDWARLQHECVKLNKHRFDPRPRNETDEESSENSQPGLSKRTAVLFRSYDAMKYSDDLIRNMRAVISELSLGSGGEYQAYLLVEVKDLKKPIWTDRQAYADTIRASVPVEFWNITVLGSAGLWPQTYPLIPPRAANVHISQWLPIQWFAQQYPQFDDYWNWELDVRYTGHYYELVKGLDTWSKKQPRKGLWERNQRFWIPKSHGGNYSEFTTSVQRRYQRNFFKSHDSSVWGPQLYRQEQERFGIKINPPTDRPTPAEDDFEWGVGEDADLITLLPMFNPHNTHYVFKDAYYNYPSVEQLAEGPPRRTTIITFFRLSHRLLHLMHMENITPPGHHMSSETWPQAVALQHGLKAVYVPHSIYTEFDWPAEAADFIFNNGDSDRTIRTFRDVPSVGEGSGAWESVFGLEREHNWWQCTWYFRTHLATKLYRRLLGHSEDGIGGLAWERTHGTYCLPPMLLHPIKAIPDPGTEEN